MKTTNKQAILATALGVFFTAARVLGQGTILWDESSNGPLSQDANNPSLLGSLQAGTNAIIGATESVPSLSTWTTFPDIFVFSIPDNLTVNSIRIQVNKNNVWSWIGDQGFLNQLGFTMNSSNGDLLSQWGFGSIGSGTYGMYIDNHDLQSVTSMANYRLDFFVESIPEPNSFSLILGGLGFLGIRRWRRPS